MKEPTKVPAKKTAAKKPIAKKTDSGFRIADAMELAKVSTGAVKAYFDYNKEQEVTTQALINGQKEIRLGEQKLEKAHMEHLASMEGLENSDKDSQRRHEETMTKLARKSRELDGKETLQDRVLAQLEAKEITAEEAALLLYGAQE